MSTIFAYVIASEHEWDKKHCQYLYKEVARMEIAKNIIILLLTLIGIILIGYGAYLSWKPLGFIVLWTTCNRLCINT